MSTGILSVIILALTAALTFLFCRYRKIVRQNRELTANEERYRLATEQTNSVIFDYDIKSSAIYFSPAFKEKYGYTPPAVGFPESAADAKIIYYEDVPDFLKAFYSCANGKKHCKIEARIQKANGEYIWCIIRMTAVFDRNAAASRILGKLSDIDSSKRRTEMLTELSERDCLTGLYNHNAIENIIESVNLSRRRSMLFIIDIDNFKAINDAFGHLEGDGCLIEIGEQIKCIFGEASDAARFGGDEFLVFCPDMSDALKAEELGQKLCRQVKQCCKLPHGRGEYEVTISVGIACSDEKDAGYKSLFEKADFAMYKAKRQGKDSCILYENQP